ncbi:pyridoxal-phosphate-dependent aminotransferase family protein [Lentibacter sp. XHP0401]|uniref:pyridoxal-phosphate-dependent aminotransferase family protein n=1 Tax=Lentibacter sp. XHP0401 TaxID=2984334 RepID=UPI0021E71D59|nr:aminotransferase class V-fold PLP-dependent enzyme [Lentibacter sp. XHP0401]MCV2892829.1 aminotransferase class V-fold PLP-dependent enzyme [Lentibacter sp. XHP0401]
MSGAGGRDYLAIPGPSVMPDAVLRAMHRAAPNIYAGELPDMMPSLIEGLKKVARTDHFATIYIGNGHAAWEAALSNIVREGDTVLGVINGHFGRGWARVAEGLGVNVIPLDCGLKAPAQGEALEAALRADKEGKIKAVLCTHVDTSTSVKNDIATLRAAIDAAGHSALLAVDCIASLGCDRFEMDAWGVDVMVAASQKGLMVPPGLGFVFFSDKAAAVRNCMDRVSHYWDWGPRSAPEALWQYFAGTAPTHHLYGLQASLEMIHSEGMEAVWARHEKLAGAIWAACETWGQGGPLTLNVPEPAHRSTAVTSLHIGKTIGTRLRQWTEGEAGLTLGIGLGMGNEEDPMADGYFRIGHMGYVNPQMIMGALGSIEAGLAALQVPRGSGALDAAAQALA